MFRNDQQYNIDHLAVGYLSAMHLNSVAQGEGSLWIVDVKPSSTHTRNDHLAKRVKRKRTKKPLMAMMSTIESSDKESADGEYSDNDYQILSHKVGKKSFVARGRAVALSGAGC
jgi:hypothetical protein